jgi:AraC-like DNA-binding protein
MGAAAYNRTVTPPERQPCRRPPTELTVTSEWSSGGIRLTTVWGAPPPTGWTAPILTTSWALTLVRRGAYRRRGDGHEHIVDANTGFLRAPGQEVSTATLPDTMELLTTVGIEPPFLHHLPDLTSIHGPVSVEPRVALAHRLLLHSLDESDDALGMEAAVVDLVRQCLRQSEPQRRIGRRGSTAAARRRLVTDVLELLNTSFCEPHGLVDLAWLVGASPYHLSRVFREVTGMTLSRYRTRLRVHAVLDRLEQGERDLSAVAAATGFADHGHMTRTVSGHLGDTPSSVRLLLARWPATSPAVTRSA